jgi:hypothetical protein
MAQRESGPFGKLTAGYGDPKEWGRRIPRPRIGTWGIRHSLLAKHPQLDDLETSEMIEAGLHPTAQQVEANVQKLEEHEAEIANPLPQ